MTFRNFPGDTLYQLKQAVLRYEHALTSPFESERFQPTHEAVFDPVDVGKPDAKFIGWQRKITGEAFPLFTITVEGHPSFGSTVTVESLKNLNLVPPQVPPCGDWSKDR
jgi:hypothetical protein